MSGKNHDCGNIYIYITLANNQLDAQIFNTFITVLLHVGARGGAVG
jgi:hypothetical protein